MEDLKSKREALKKAMKAQDRWHDSYDHALASMPEDTLDYLIDYWTAPIRVA